MSNFLDIKNTDQKYIAPTYSRFDLDVQKGEGAVLENSQGDKFIDFSSGIGVNSIGYKNPDWIAAVKHQIDNLSHISNLYYTQPQAELAEKLCEKTGMKKVFFANSGAEANEGAIKVARKYSSDKYSDDRHEIITLVNSFHGRTITTLSATGQDVFHQHFGPFTPGFVFAKANDIQHLKSKLSDKTCAIMLECIQGEGGVIPLDPEFLEAVQEICEQQDILLLVDEVQTGIGRCGKLLCSEFYNITPDVITLAKGLGGGLPIGAFLMGARVENVLSYGDHATTFGGNPIVAAGANVVLDTIDENFLNSVTQKGDYLRQKLENMEGVVSISGKGLMLGIELEDGLVSTEIVKECIKNGLVLLTAKHKLRLLPPLTITTQEMDTGLNILSDVLKNAVNS